MPAQGTSRRPVASGRAKRLILAAIMPLALAACAKSINVRGNLPDPEIVSKISPGVDTKADVASLLGSPSTISTFQDNKWYYIGQKSTQFAFFAPEVLERKIIEVVFDPAGKVTESKIYTLADAEQIEPVDRITPTEGRELTVLQQILGNVGRFPSAKTQ
jgi:outer membrane protein assembly factor BamE (lipoprotein component of BamABCDE complex)